MNWPDRNWGRRNAAFLRPSPDLHLRDFLYFRRTSLLTLAGTCAAHFGRLVRLCRYSLNVFLLQFYNISRIVVIVVMVILGFAVIVRSSQLAFLVTL